MRKRLFAIAIAVALTGCGKNAQQGEGGSSSILAGDSENVATVKRLVLSRLASMPNPTMTLNSEDESWSNVLRLRTRTVGWLRPNIGCGNGAPENRKIRINPKVDNYSGNFIVPPGSSINTREDYVGMIISDLGLVMYKSASLHGSLGDTMNFTCQVFTDKLHMWLEQNPTIVSGAPDQPVIAFANRGEPKFSFQNEYKTDLPGKGNSTAVSLTFSYPMISKITRLGVVSEGSGQAKAFYDNDTGQWSFAEFSVTDGNLSFSPQGDTTLQVSELDAAAVPSASQVVPSKAEADRNGYYIGVRPINAGNPLSSGALSVAKSVFPPRFESIGVKVDDIHLSTGGGSIILKFKNFDFNRIRDVKNAITGVPQWAITSECSHEDC